jgi:hypothetical protein
MPGKGPSNFHSALPPSAHLAIVGVLAVHVNARPLIDRVRGLIARDVAVELEAVLVPVQRVQLVSLEVVVAEQYDRPVLDGEGRNGQLADAYGQNAYNVK